MSPGSEEVASTNAPGIELAQLSGESPWMKKKQETPKFRSPVFALYARRASLDTSTGMGRFSQQPEQSSGPDSISSPPTSSSILAARRFAAQDNERGIHANCGHCLPRLNSRRCCHRNQAIHVRVRYRANDVNEDDSMGTLSIQLAAVCEDTSFLLPHTRVAFVGVV